MSFELLDEVLGSSSGLGFSREDSEEKDLYAYTDTLVENAMMEYLRDTVMNRDDIDSDEKISQLSLIESTTLDEKHLTNFMEGVIHPAFMLSGGMDTSKKINLSIPIYEMVGAISESNDRDSLREELYEIAEKYEFDEEELKEAVDYADSVIDAYGVDGIYLMTEAAVALATVAFNEGDVILETKANADILQQDIATQRAPVVQKRLAKEAKRLKSHGEKALSLADKAKKNADLEQIRQLKMKIKKYRNSPGVEETELKALEKALADSKELFNKTWGTFFGNLKKSAMKHWESVKLHGRAAMEHMGEHKGAYIAGAIGVAGLTAIGATIAIMKRKCAGLHGEEKSRCKVAAYNEGIKEAHKKLAECKESHNPEKCKEKINRIIEKYEAKKHHHTHAHA